MSRYEIREGDAASVLATLPEGIAQTCVTSPPYFGLRDYGVDGQIGLEQTPDAYVARLVEVFRQVRRVLKPDGTLWLNLGDSYATQPAGNKAPSGKSQSWGAWDAGANNPPRPRYDVKPKDLLGIPWRVAFALQSDGWWLRSAIVWHKPNPMPESVTDRPTSSYEMVFLLAKSATYYYDAEANRTPFVHEEADRGHPFGNKNAVARGVTELTGNMRPGVDPEFKVSGANARNVWTIATQPFSEAHFAVMPPELARRCILAGSREGDTVLDCFNGAATTGVAALETFRRYLGVELNPSYIEISRRRLDAIDCQPPLFGEVAA